MKTILNLLALLLITVAVSVASDKTVIRVGHFPNITHAQGLVAHNLSRQGKGWFEARLGPGVEIQWFTYNAGPSAMEAIFAKSIELTYVGPGPALNAYAKSQGEEIRIIAGAANGGAALVVQPDANLKAPADFKGKKIATPQLGNTQDISCRAWLTSGGLRITQLGGDAQVLWSVIIATDNGVRNVPPIFGRAARTMGSKGLHTWFNVILPASLPFIVSGMKQGWAFAWRSLMAAEIYVTILTGFGLGHLLHYGRELNGLFAVSDG